jgi:hypothetical protein
MIQDTAELDTVAGEVVFGDNNMILMKRNENSIGNQNLGSLLVGIFGQ